jgi:hypothetical protein
VSFPPRLPSSEPPYGPPPYGPPPFGPPQDPAPGDEPIWKKTWVRVVAVLVVLGVISSATDDDKTPEEVTAATPEAPVAVESPAPVGSAAPVEEPAEELAPEPALPGIGQSAADGDFNFVVQGVDCSFTELGGEYFGTTAMGQFCVVSLTVTNIGISAQTFAGDNATLFNAAGQQFSADSGAALYLDDSSFLYEEINPGNTLNSKVVFDVPAGTTPTAIELHDSMLSGGVTVALQ